MENLKRIKLTYLVLGIIGLVSSLIGLLTKSENIVFGLITIFCIGFAGLFTFWEWGNTLK